MSHNPLEPSSAPAISPWLASILMRRGGALPRFALAYQRLAAMPRRWRRQLVAQFVDCLLYTSRCV